MDLTDSKYGEKASSEMTVMTEQMSQALLERVVRQAVEEAVPTLWFAEDSLKWIDGERDRVLYAETDWAVQWCEAIQDVLDDWGLGLFVEPVNESVLGVYGK